MKLKEVPALKVITVAGPKSKADLSVFMFFSFFRGGGGLNSPHSAALNPSGSAL